MIQNTGLESLCILKNTSKEIAAAIESYMNLQFSQNQMQDRHEILEKTFSNKKNAAKIVEILNRWQWIVKNEKWKIVIDDREFFTIHYSLLYIFFSTPNFPLLYNPSTLIWAFWASSVL